MLINGKEYVLVELYAKGYYSGSEESHCGFFPKEVYEEYAGEFDSYTPYFHELDGKHSEVEGEVIIYEDFVGAAKALLRMTDDWKVWEGLGDSVFDDYSVIEQLEEESDSIVTSIKTTTVVTIGDEKVVIE